MLKNLLYTLAVATFVAIPAIKTLAEESHPSAGGTTVSHDGAAHEKGEIMPDMGKAASWVSALWVIIIFCIMLAILYPTAWKNVIAGLKARVPSCRVRWGKGGA